MQTEEIFKLPNGSYLLISNRVSKALEKYRQLEDTAVEQGGMLFGVTRATEKQLFDVHVPPCIELTHISEPNEGDMATRSSFKRRSNSHFKRLNSLKEQSNGKTVYLGEWHTHPENSPRPSKTDVKSWGKDFKGKMAIVCILGIDQDWWGYWSNNKIVKLERVTLSN